MTLPRAALDSPWKDVLRTYFPQAMQFFFPNTAALVDWSKPYEFLDKEFQQISRDGELGRRFADQLVKVWLNEGESIWLLLHVEVQSQYEAIFCERMFSYGLRIFDRFRVFPVCLAILCDDSRTWRPHQFNIDYPNTRLHFEFGMVKLLDLRDRWAELEASQNPFATVTMAHLKTLDTRPDENQRKVWKLSLIRALYDKGYERQDILNLYRFIDWAMILTEELEQECWSELTAFEEERKVTYVTTGERIGFERGKSEGVQEGEQTGAVREARSLVLRLLARRVGTLPATVEAQVQALALPQLEALGEALLDFVEPADLTNWLRLHQSE
jgi:Domain of unknown function (DUF4351)